MVRRRTMNKDGAIRAQNQAKIIAAAEIAFAQHGFKGTSVQKVADEAGLPKTNVLYYFKNKEGLYMAVLERILNLWNSTFDRATVADDPAKILARYIAEKMEVSRIKPLASKIFALEIINGAPNLSDFFKHDHAEWMRGRVTVIEGWIAAGKMNPIDPHYLLYNIWASTQHYADFSAQITHLRGEAMAPMDYREATRTQIRLILNGCGLDVPTEFQS